MRTVLTHSLDNLLGNAHSSLPFSRPADTLYATLGVIRVQTQTHI